MCDIIFNLNLGCYFIDVFDIHYLKNGYKFIIIASSGNFMFVIVIVMKKLYRCSLKKTNTPINILTFS